MHVDDLQWVVALDWAFRRLVLAGNSVGTPSALTPPPSFPSKTSPLRRAVLTAHREFVRRVTPRYTQFGSPEHLKAHTLSAPLFGETWHPPRLHWRGSFSHGQSESAGSEGAQRFARSSRQGRRP
jgi:hypothetical protein